jgi:uncharacterized small protein (DUF1192 family)
MRGVKRVIVVWTAMALAVVAAEAQEGPGTTAQAVQAPAIERLQQRIEELTGELARLRTELEQLKKQQEEQAHRAELGRLRQAALAEASGTGTEQEVDTTTRFVSGTRMQPQLNPEISVTGDMFLVGGDHQQEELQARHFELDIQSYLDPYTRMHVVFGYHGRHHESSFGLPADAPEQVEGGEMHLGEGYITWLQLPGGLSLTVGKKRQQFGVLNRWHLHALDQSDLPWVLQESFGDHGLTGTGVSLDWLMPRLWAHTNELTFEITDGDNGVAFAGESWQHPSFLARLKNYWDLSENSYFELGLDVLHGSADRDGRLGHDFFAADFAYNWYPAGRELYREVTVRGMLLRSELDLAGDGERDAWGGFLYGQMKFSPHWIAGLRYDRVDDQREAGHRYWGLSPYLTFWQSEFVRLRAQASYRKDNLLGTDHRYQLQITFAAGPHKHDSY